MYSFAEVGDSGSMVITNEGDGIGVVWESWTALFEECIW
jgi:hypothetical protein